MLEKMILERLKEFRNAVKRQRLNHKNQLRNTYNILCEMHQFEIELDEAVLLVAFQKLAVGSQIGSLDSIKVIDLLTMDCQGGKTTHKLT
jgi:hypothetical protein